MNRYLYGFAVGLIFALGSSTYFYKSKYEKAAKQLIEINEISQLLEQKIKDENAEFERKQAEFKQQLAAADEKRLADIADARASFIVERLRLQADSESHRKARDDLSASLKTCSRDAAEAERLLLLTLDEAELINAAYASCRSSLIAESAD